MNPYRLLHTWLQSIVWPLLCTISIIDPCQKYPHRKVSVKLGSSHQRLTKMASYDVSWPLRVVSAYDYYDKWILTCDIWLWFWYVLVPLNTLLNRDIISFNYHMALANFGWARASTCMYIKLLAIYPTFRHKATDKHIQPHVSHIQPLAPQS